MYEFHRDRATAAAIELLASEGIRALTHLRVDDRAGLPRGSTSNVFRTREALLLGVCEHMVTSELPEITLGFSAETPAEFTAALTTPFHYLVGPSRTMTAARLALIVEGGTTKQSEPRLPRAGWASKAQSCPHS